MYRHSDIMWFDEDEDYIKSLTLGSGKRVMCVCPICNDKRLLYFISVNNHQSTMCNSCAKRYKSFNKIVGKRFSRLVVVSMVDIKLKGLMVLCRCDCGKEVVVEGSNLKSGHTQSCGCLQVEAVTALCGSSHYRYNHNLSNEQRDELEKSRRSLNFHRFRKAVKERDNNMCVICGAEKDLVVHHLENFKNNELLRYEVSNGVTLCRACHVEFHTVFLGGYHIPCTEQDFNEYVLQI